MAIWDRTHYVILLNLDPNTMQKIHNETIRTKNIKSKQQITQETKLF